MKIRNGFISNSSSSSFVVGIPKRMNKREEIDFIINKMGVNKDSLFYNVAEEIADIIVRQNKTKKDIASDNGYKNWEEMSADRDSVLVQSVKNIVDKDLKLFYGSVCSENGDPSEIIFMDMEWFANEKDFFIRKFCE